MENDKEIICQDCDGLGIIKGDSHPYGDTVAKEPDILCPCMVEELESYELISSVYDRSILEDLTDRTPNGYPYSPWLY